MIRKLKADWRIYSRKQDPKTGKRRNLGTVDTKEAAQQHEREIQYFKRHSDALDLDEGVFTWNDPKRIAKSLKASAEKSKRRKGSPLQSAMSMLTFYINRAGEELDADQRKVLEAAKDELRAAFEND